MTDQYLESLSLNELKQLQKNVAQAIARHEDRQKAEALVKIDSVAREMGFSLAELIGSADSRTRAPAVPKYRHPNNPSLTWAGRGRQPKWFLEAMEAGKTPEDLAIE